MFAIHKPTGIYIGKLSLEEVIDKYGTATPLNDKQKLAVLGWIELSRHKCFNFVELKRGQYVKASYFLPNSAKISYLIGLGNVNVNGIVCNFADVPFLGVDEFSIIA